MASRVMPAYTQFKRYTPRERDEEGNPFKGRFYHPIDAAWPKYNINVRNDVRFARPGDELVLRIFISKKDSSDSWWESGDLPVALMSELVELLHAAKRDVDENAHKIRHRKKREDL